MAFLDNAASITIADRRRVFACIDLISLGLQGGRIALMHRELVDALKWIFGFGVWSNRIGLTAGLQGRLVSMTAAVVGVMGNLIACFALHVLLTEAGRRHFGPLRL